jgi:hypothetical protein
MKKDTINLFLLVDTLNLAGKHWAQAEVPAGHSYYKIVNKETGAQFYVRPDVIVELTDGSAIEKEHLTIFHWDKDKDYYELKVMRRKVDVKVVQKFVKYIVPILFNQA